MSLLQILQQGIQAKERAQQASIDAGLRRLQIGKEEALQRERFTFEAESDSLNKQHDLLVLARKLDSDAMNRNQEQAHETKLQLGAQAHDTSLAKRGELHDITLMEGEQDFDLGLSREEGKRTYAKKRAIF